MKKIFFIFLFLVSFEVFPCSPIFYDYMIADGKVYYEPGKKEIPGVDLATFKKINTYFAKDKNRVYYLGKVIEGADSETFKFLGGYKTLTEVSGYSKDNKNVYYFERRILEADPETFEVIGLTSYAKDKNNVYKGDMLISGIDSRTFKVLENYFTKDKNGIYYRERKLEGADPEKYEQNGHYIKSNGTVYKNSDKMFYDYKSFEVIEEIYIYDSCGGASYDGSFTKDKNGFYKDDKKSSKKEYKDFKNSRSK